MLVIAVQISRFVDEDQPGWVECVLLDAAGQRHTFIQKVPVVSDADLWSTGNYPQMGVIACEVEKEWQDEAGRTLVLVDTERPWDVESTAGVCRFVLLASQVSVDVASV